MQANKFYYISLIMLPTSLAFNVDFRDWQHEILGVETNTSDPSRMSVEFRVDRIRRGHFALSGTLMWNYDVDNDTMLELTSYYSPTGSNDYKQLPYTLVRQQLYDYINGFYKTISMKSVATCSNLPQFEDTFKPPLEKKIYTINRCDLLNDKVLLPTHLSPGFYKMLLSLYGPVEWHVNTLFKITLKGT